MSALASVMIERGGVATLPWTIVAVEKTSKVNIILKIAGKFLHEETTGTGDVETTSAQLRAQQDAEDGDPIKHFDGYEVKMFVGETKTGDFQQLTCFDIPISDILDLFGRYFKIKLLRNIAHAILKDEIVIDDANGDENNGSSNVKPDAFSVLMSTSKSTQSLPPKKSEINQKFALYNSIIDFLHERGLGFSVSSSLQIGRDFIQLLCNIFWCIGPHIHTLQDRYCQVPHYYDALLSFNNPQSSKHTIKPLQSDTVLDFAVELDKMILQPFMNHADWTSMKSNLIILAESLHRYVAYLTEKRLKTATNHESKQSIRNQQNERLQHLEARHTVKSHLIERYASLNETLKDCAPHEIVDLSLFTPAPSREKRYYIDCLHEGIRYPCSLFSYAYGNSLGTYHFIWKNGDDKLDLGISDLHLITKIKADMPVYHTRQMRKEFIQLCGTASSISHLRHVYKEITGDNSSAESAEQTEIDERVRLMYAMEDFDIVTDLRKHNKGRPPIYETFFQKCAEYLSNVVEETVDDRRHEKYTYLASAISVRDLRNCVSQICDPDTAIPSEQWLRLQFAPKVPSARSSLQHTGRLNVRYMVQSRIYRSKHEDDHYCAALFRYLKEFCVKFRDICLLVAMDDKHFCKVGEPGNPIAAVDRGKRVLVSGNQTLAVSDHDFAKSSLIPSVTMLIDIPVCASESFYDGEVYVGLKDHVFQSSSPFRHSTELSKILIDKYGEQVPPVLALHTDGGPDHRCNYLSVQASLIALFLKLNLDMLLAVRTAPNASWRNPPERVMSDLNLALNCVGLMRAKMSDEYEELISSCNTMQSIREKAGIHEGLESAFMASLDPVKAMLGNLFTRLVWKERPIKLFDAASKDNIEHLISYIQLIDPNISPSDQSATLLKSKTGLRDFIDHCCHIRHYSFTIRKCGSDECNICKPPRLSQSQLESLYWLPDPVPDPDNKGHYKQFDSLFGSETTEEHRPGNKQKISLSHGLPFSPTAQTCRTIKRIVNCQDCNKPRVIYCERKLDIPSMRILDRILELYEYTCGCALQDLKQENTARVNSVLDKIFVRNNIKCEDDIEIPYFSSHVFKDICIKCGSENQLIRQEGLYPICAACTSSKLISTKARKRNLHIERAAKKSKS